MAWGLQNCNCMSAFFGQTFVPHIFFSINKSKFNYQGPFNLLIIMLYAKKLPKRVNLTIHVLKNNFPFLATARLLPSLPSIFNVIVPWLFHDFRCLFSCIPYLKTDGTSLFILFSFKDSKFSWKLLWNDNIKNWWKLC